MQNVGEGSRARAERPSLRGASPRATWPRGAASQLAVLFHSRAVTLLRCSTAVLFSGPAISQLSYVQ